MTYAIKGNSLTDQAEVSTKNPAAANTQMRILIELQVQTLLMAEYFGSAEDIQKLRQDVADSIT